MRYCRTCILPDTRPGITLDDDGVCSACLGHRLKEDVIDWPARARKFEQLADDAKASGAGYDCIVPVSGGKDSWYQVIKCQELGLNVLAVTWRTPGRTDIGQRNLDQLIHCLGVDHIDYSIDPDVERRFMKATFEAAGSTAVPMHLALFAIPIRLAVQFHIPLVVWGENPQLEYGGFKAEQLAEDLDLDWLRRHGVNNNTTIDDWISDQLSASDLAGYRLPPREDFVGKTRSVFLGSFYKWNSYENAEIAASRGFSYGDQDRKTGTWDFADIDCDYISLHHLLKWYKFGITRAFDNLSVQIRYGLIERDEAIETFRQVGLQIPREDISKFCAFVGESEAWFWQVVECFRNPEIWRRSDGVWQIPNFLIPDWTWS